MGATASPSHPRKDVDRADQLEDDQDQQDHEHELERPGTGRQRVDARRQVLQLTLGHGGDAGRRIGRADAQGLELALDVIAREERVACGAASGPSLASAAAPAPVAKASASASPACPDFTATAQAPGDGAGASLVLFLKCSRFSRFITRS
jgi:hypothetical protein